jgi:uncharacterized membrane protein YadS
MNGSKGRPLAVSTIQVCGIVLMIVVVGVWIIQDRQSSLLVGAAMAMIGGSGLFEFAVYQAGKLTRPAPPDPPETPE